MGKSRLANMTTKQNTGFSGIRHLLSTPEFNAGYEAGSNSPHYLTAIMPPEEELNPPYANEEQNRIWLIGYKTAVI